MGIWDTLTDLIEAATPWVTAEAEAPAAQEDQVRLFSPSQPMRSFTLAEPMPIGDSRSGEIVTQ